MKVAKKGKTPKQMSQATVGKVLMRDPGMGSPPGRLPITGRGGKKAKDKKR